MLRPAAGRKWRRPDPGVKITEYRGGSCDSLEAQRLLPSAMSGTPQRQPKRGSIA